MFSRLDPYFTATMRHAESADARLAIRRDEQQEQGRGKDAREEKEDKSAVWEDSTVVSVRALQAFLVSLTADQAPAAGGAAALSAAPAPVGQAADAARAYQTTARAAAPSPPPAPAASADKPALTAEELRTIHRLIDDLKFLADRKVEQLNILRSDSFLQSLVDAAARARSAL